MITRAFAFQLGGRPATWQRGVRGLRYDSRGDVAREYRKKVGLVALQALQRAKLAGLDWPPLTDKAAIFSVDVVGWWPDRNQGDEDRLVSLVRDALEGVAYKSDRQVKASRNAIGPVCQPGTEGIAVIVRAIDEHERARLALDIHTDAVNLSTRQHIRSSRAVTATTSSAARRENGGGS